MRSLALVLCLVGCATMAQVPPAVTVSGGQTVTGAKTFSSLLTASAGFDLTGTLALKSTAATNTFTCATLDATTSASVSACTFKLAANITAADLGWSFRDSSDAIAMSLTEAGAMTLGSTLTNQTWLGSATDTAGQIAHKIGNTTSMALSDDRYLVSFTRDNGSTEVANLTTGGKFSLFGDIQHTNTGASFKLISETNSATATSTLAATTVKTNAALGANDLEFEVQDSAAAHLFTVDHEGDVTVLGTAQVAGGTLTLSASGTNTLTSSTTDATTSATVGAITLKAAADLTDADLLLDVQNSAAGHAFTVTEQGAGAFIGGLSVTGGAITANNGLSTGGSTMNSNTLQSVTATTMTYRSDIADGSSAIGHKFSNFTNLATAGAKIANFSTNNFGTEQAAVMNTGFFIQPAQTATIANDGNGGTAPATTITPTSNSILMAYNDPQNSSVGTLSETGAQAGTKISILHTGSGGTVVFTDSSGVQEVGGTACTMAVNAIMEAVYLNSQWNITSCRQN